MTVFFWADEHKTATIPFNHRTFQSLDLFQLHWWTTWMNGKEEWQSRQKINRANCNVLGSVTNVKDTSAWQPSNWSQQEEINLLCTHAVQNILTLTKCIHYCFPHMQQRKNCVHNSEQNIALSLWDVHLVPQWRTLISSRVTWAMTSLTLHSWDDTWSMFQRNSQSSVSLSGLLLRILL